MLDRIDADSAWRVWVRKASLDEPPVADHGPDFDVNAMTLDDIRALIFVVRSNPDFIGRGSQPNKPLHQATAKELRNALLLVTKYQEAHPDDFWFNWYEASSSLVVQPRRPQSGLQYAHAALAVRPDSPEMNYLIGYLLLESRPGVEDEAISFFNKVLDLDARTSAPPWVWRSPWTARRTIPCAITAYKKAIELNPEYSR